MGFPRPSLGGSCSQKPHMGKKDPFKVEDRPMNFNVTTYEKFTDNEFRFLTAANLLETTHCQFSM